MQATDGNMEGQLEETLEKLDGFVEGFQDGWVPRCMVWLGFRSMIWPSMAFPFAACNFTPQEAETITKTLWKIMISKFGVAKNFPKEYLHVPLSLQGLDFPDVKVEQGIQKIARAWIQGDTGSQMGDLLQMNLEQAQLQVGVGTPLLETLFELFGCLCPQTWVKGLWEFMSTHGISLATT